MDDMDRMQQGAVDTAYEQMFGQGLGDKETDRQVGFQAVPAFPRYHLKPVKARAGFSRQKNSPMVNVTCEVLDGPDGTVGRRLYDSGGIYFIPGLTRRARKEEVAQGLADEDGRMQRNDEEMEKARTNMRGGLLRIQNHLKLATGFPPNIEQAGLDLYAGQFENAAQSFIGEVRMEKGTDGQNRNRVVWQSVAAPDTAETDDAGKPTGKTALQASKEAIDTFNNRGKRKPVRQGATARAYATDPLA